MENTTPLNKQEQRLQVLSKIVTENPVHVGPPALLPSVNSLSIQASNVSVNGKPIIGETLTLQLSDVPSMDSAQVSLQVNENLLSQLQRGSNAQRSSHLFGSTQQQSLDAETCSDDSFYSAEGQTSPQSYPVTNPNATPDGMTSPMNMPSSQKEKEKKSCWKFYFSK